MDLINLDVDFHGHLKGLLSEVIVNGNFILPTALTAVGDVQHRVDNIVLPHSQLPDVLVWKQSSDGSFSSKHAFFLCPHVAVHPWAEII